MQQVGGSFGIAIIAVTLETQITAHHVAGAAGESHFDVTEIPDVSDELLMYGLLECIYEPPRQENNSGIRSALWPQRPTYRHVWTAKSFRLRYWLAFRDALPSALTRVAET
jgi:hypothetical protein